MKVWNASFCGTANAFGIPCTAKAGAHIFNDTTDIRGNA